jgi:hypothetical protein
MLPKPPIVFHRDNGHLGVNSYDVQKMHCEIFWNLF